jgi:hypothetical protein
MKWYLWVLAVVLSLVVYVTVAIFSSNYLHLSSFWANGLSSILGILPLIILLDKYGKKKK